MFLLKISLDRYSPRLKLNDSLLPDPSHFSFQFFCIFLGGLECVAHFVFLGDVWIRTQRAAVSSRCATNLATHLPIATHLS
jgi:hypothetical protein